MQYLPLDPENIDKPVSFGDIQITLKAVEEDTYIATRVLDVAGFEVTHYHFVAWDDLEAPEEKSLSDLRKLIRDLASFIMMQAAESEPQRLVVHCKSGIGRTGTAMALINVAIILLKQTSENSSMKIGDAELSVFSIVRQLRE